MTRSVIVTGAASGIGREAVTRLATDGVNVVAVDLEEAGLRACIDDFPESVVPVVGDAADKCVIDEAARAATARDGQLDGFFANAGIAGSGAALADLELEEVLEVFRVNAGAAFLAARTAATMMNAGGSLVLTSSVAGLRASAGSVAYSASKAAVVSMAQTASVALAGRGIRVNAICPGLVRTPMTEGFFVRAERAGTTDRIGKLNPLERPGDPAEVANLAVFLLGPDSSYVNGQAICVDGGLSATHPFSSWRR